MFGERYFRRILFAVFDYCVLCVVFRVFEVGENCKGSVLSYDTVMEFRETEESSLR